jgi:hypothetical protein
MKLFQCDKQKGLQLRFDIQLARAKRSPGFQYTMTTPSKHSYSLQHLFLGSPFGHDAFEGVLSLETEPCCKVHNSEIEQDKCDENT